MRRDTQETPPSRAPQQGQALIEYVLIVVLVAIAFGVALAATGPAIGNVFSNSIRDLLRQTEVGEIPGREQFWLTVTYAYENPLRERPRIPNTPAPPTQPPTPGPSPTPEPTRTASPESPTPLPTLTPTPKDVTHVAPWRDTVENESWWRMDPNLDLGQTNWAVEYFGNVNLTGDPIRRFSGVTTWPRIALDIPNGLAPYAGGPTANYSARFTRQVEVGVARSLRFSVMADDGVRVLLNGTNVALTNVGGQNAAWGGMNGQQLFTGFANANAGNNTIVVEYRQDAGPAKLFVDVQAGGPNVNDQAIAGGTTGARCNWGRADISENVSNPNIRGNNANTEPYMFEEYVGGNIPQKTRCHLELRGAVFIPETWTGAELSFWDVWDFTGNGLSGYLEVAEYVPEIEPETGNMRLNRGAVNWKKIQLRQGNTANYNWSHSRIDLTPHINFAALGPERLITFRFVMENDTNNSTRRWYIDDIAVTEKQNRILAVDQYWTLDDLTNDWNLADPNSVYNHFIFTGGVSNAGNISGTRLVGNNKFGPSGQALHDSAGPLDDPGGVAGTGPAGANAFTSYKRHTESPNSNDLRLVRANTIEINGYIDLNNVPNPDRFNNSGPPVLTFYYGYDLGNRTAFQVEYTTDSYDTPANQVNWVAFTDGRLRNITTVAPGDGRVRRTALTEHQISLRGLPGNPARIRIRWALYVHRDATRFDGYWLDEIRLGREESPKWVDYPFYDGAQVATINNWRFNGQWSRTDETGRQNSNEPVDDPNYKRFSFASSPNSRYQDGESTWMELRYPVDLLNDTPDKRWADPNKTGPNNTFNQPAQNPVLTFYHWRDLAPVDHFRVEWKRLEETETQWRLLWMYNHGMQTDSTNRNVRTAQQFAWEPVTVDLRPVMQQILPGEPNANRLDDDIVIRFVLQADGAGNARGLYIDDIRIQERNDVTWRLWPNDENRNNPVNNTPLGNGNGTFFIADADVNSTGRGWWDEWSNGGGWTPVAYEKRFGSLAFHDSIGTSMTLSERQNSAPTGNLGQDFGEARFHTPVDTFNVLQLNTILDLRAVDATREAPALTFWTRHHIGNGARLLIQVSEMMTGSDADIDNAMRARCENQPVVQCYEQNRGWTRWVTVPDWPRLPNGESRWYAWTRGMVDLRPYAHNFDTNTPGKRIRIRFVLDNLDATSTFDGWYIDNITIDYRNPPRNVTIINERAFDDRSRNMNNWVAEGLWGLAPDVYQGGGGGPANLGLWDVSWWRCTVNCGNMPVAANDLLANPPAPERSSLPPLSNIPPVDQIAYDMGNGSPVPGWNVTDRFVGRFVLNTGRVGEGSFAPGNRTFMATADDGVRIKVEELVGGVPQPIEGNEWNVLNSWRNQAPTTSTGTFNFLFGREYRVTLEYFENTGGAVLILSVGDGRYSFTDSPKLAAAGRDVEAIPFANSSLVLDNLLDLRGMADNEFVIMEYHSMYKLTSGEWATVEVSNNGGFNWTRDNLQREVRIGGTVIIPASRFASTRFDNAHRTAAQGWQVRQNNLTDYKGQILLVRFRLDRQNVWCKVRGRCDDVGGSPLERFESMYYNGWWITPVIIRKF